MNLKSWLSGILVMGLILALIPLSAQARPYSFYDDHPKYHHPRGNAYGWHGPKHHGRQYNKHFRHHGKGPCHSPYYAHHAGPPPVAYVAPVTPVIGIPYAQPQPYYSQPAIPGFSGNLNWNF